VRKTSSTATAGDEGMAGTAMTATFTTTATRIRVGQAWATCPCHAQDGCRTCQGSGVVTTPRLYTDDIDLTTYLTERTTW
jgi:hypothetical protein